MTRLGLLPSLAGLAALGFGVAGVFDEVGDCLEGAGGELEEGAELGGGDAGVPDEGEELDLVAEEAEVGVVVVGEEEGGGTLKVRARAFDEAHLGVGGLYARELTASASAVVCVDQSAAMLAQLPAGKKLIAVTAGAAEVASGRVRLPYRAFDALLLKEVLHHVGDRAAVIAGLAGLLGPGGRMLVVMLPARIGYPLFAAALDLFTRLQPDPAGVAEQMRAAGLEAEVTEEGFPLAFPAGRYLQMVRNRYMSLLSHFDDAQLAAGIEEISRAHPGPGIGFEDRLAFILGVKK